jgi:hypothetical protein
MAKQHLDDTPDYLAEGRRALELLASSADGCTAALLFAHCFADAVIAGLVDAGLVAVTTERVIDGEHTVDVMLFNITDHGRATLER